MRKVIAPAPNSDARVRSGNARRGMLSEWFQLIIIAAVTLAVVILICNYERKEKVR